MARWRLTTCSALVVLGLKGSRHLPRQKAKHIQVTCTSADWWPNNSKNREFTPYP